MILQLFRESPVGCILRLFCSHNNNIQPAQLLFVAAETFPYQTFEMMPCHGGFYLFLGQGKTKPWVVILVATGQQCQIPIR